MKTGSQRDRDMLAQLSAATGKNFTQIAKDAGVAVTTITRLGNDKTSYRLSASTIDKLKAAFPDFFSDDPDVVDLPAYVEVDVLPSFAGMGGGGFGDGDPGRALIPRQLIEDRFHGNPGDFLLIDVRGDSMEDVFFHGDQILIDRRDRDPAQPGPFCLHDGDAYVVKLVERVPMKRGWLRIFSTNPRYTDYEVNENEVRIIGRPAWFSRAI